ncbi:hydrogenase nickel incorporation protein HypB [Natronomonas sp.]|uniref:hydrogenase nickel incorporation protein HypB n=1 Tax=Natronomonas sp. TaxID=2184060 RepID=UPI0026253895|nr:hydrogenase nickel incorporation protein HypB [Natronomonas sp.]
MRHAPKRGVDATLRNAVEPILSAVRAHRFGHGEGGSAPSDGEAEADVLAAVEREAAAVHKRLARDGGVFAAEFLGATGSGKTALVEALLDRRPDGERAAVIAGDVAGDDDATRYRSHGVPVVDVTTGTDCHLDPARVGRAIDELDLGGLDRLFVENVGNMVCPADFPLGASLRVVVVSVTEGDDVVRKHPLVFQACDLVVINKTDIAGAVGADVARMREDARAIAPETPVVATSAETGAGIDRLRRLLDRGPESHGDGYDHDHDHGSGANRADERRR